MRCFVSSLITDEIENNFKILNCSVIKLPPYSRLPDPVSTHPDMLINILPNNKILTYGEYYRQNRVLFDNLEYEIITEENIPQNKYPYDIALNALQLGNKIIGRIDMTSNHILKNYPEQIKTNQGYARCSVCKIDENNIITADESISAAVSSFANVTMIKYGYIKLNGYDYGFIGGACGKLKNSIVFFGNINTHPDSKKITASIERCGCDIICIKNGELYDYGGIVFI